MYFLPPSICHIKVTSPNKTVEKTWKLLVHCLFDVGPTEKKRPYTTWTWLFCKIDVPDCFIAIIFWYHEEKRNRETPIFQITQSDLQKYIWHVSYLNTDARIYKWSHGTPMPGSDKKCHHFYLCQKSRAYFSIPSLWIALDRLQRNVHLQRKLFRKYSMYSNLIFWFLP